MSEQSISDKSQIIRNETQQHANTRGRVADVIDDINATKANKTDVTDVEGDISVHLGDFNNPHQVTKSQVGLGNADNTADIDKPISIAVQLELDDIRTDIQGQTDWNEAQDGRLDQLEQHNIDQDTALGNKANTDASNISPENSELWRKKLNVPQIPDSVISIGAVTADSSTVYLGLPLTGKNTVLIDGQTYERTDAQSFPFTPVTTGEKILIIHALPDSQVFHLVQGAESTEAVEPSYSGLFVARLLVTTEGINIEEATAGFKEKANDGWRYITLADNDPKIIEITASPSHSFNLQPLTIANEPKIVGIKSVGDKNTWDGNELLFFIDGDSEVTFVSGAYDEGLNYVTYAFAETVIGKPYTYMRFKRKNWYYHHIPAGGGGKASEVENDSAVTGASVKDALETLKAADKIETVVIALSPYNEDLTDNVSRLGFGVLTFPLKVLSFQTSAYPVPTGSGITTQIRKNGVAVTTTHSVIPAGANNSSTSPTPVFSDDTFAIGDRLNFFTPTGGVGSTVKGQNLVATLIIERL